MAALDDFLLGGDWFSGADGRTGDFMSMVERFTRAIELLEWLLPGSGDFRGLERKVVRDEVGVVVEDVLRGYGLKWVVCDGGGCVGESVLVGLVPEGWYVMRCGRFVFGLCRCGKQWDGVFGAVRDGVVRVVSRDGEGFKCVVGDLADPGVGEWLCGVLRDL